ncbi:uncharacterized protein E0L32_004378 [Thyridium curvatum]|uniref:HIT-type domain-containing protein n=1 Tax=Thyridium curvatum TaxID=1093900 RepID=A0A507BF46_9PEZI|nr:uncharacterized protein E0L32_004378 [Thyridium curvatum]TPX15398.1 hypothetical protein E0L32_004378 [Thyridium curvatum]
MSTNFGVVELASTRTTNAPGWAYVPDVSIQAAALKQGGGGGNRKRAARNQPNASLSDLTARQATKVRRELEALDRDSHRDANIAIPPRPGGASSARTQNKHTPNVRKILMSQKTFANHLDDYFAMQALHDGNNSPHPAAPSSAATTTAGSRRPAAPPPGTGGSSGGPSNKKKKVAAATSAAAATETAEDTPMPDADAASSAAASQDAASTLLAPYTGRMPPPGLGDADPLLASRVPPLPTDEELRALLAAPPLAYGEARGEVGGGEGRRRYPGRVFCEVCGYWGRVACLKCGTRVCALACLEVHREECVTRAAAFSIVKASNHSHVALHVMPKAAFTYSGYHRLHGETKWQSPSLQTFGAQVGQRPHLVKPSPAHTSHTPSTFSPSRSPRVTSAAPRVIQRELDVALARAAGARGLEAARRAHGPRRAHALLPPALGDVDRGPALDGAERELGAARRARRAGRRPAALLDRARDAAADAQLGHVLVVEDDVAALRVDHGGRVDGGRGAHVQDLKVLQADGDVGMAVGHRPGGDAGEGEHGREKDGRGHHFQDLM